MEATKHPTPLVISDEVDSSDLSAHRPQAVSYPDQEGRGEDWQEPGRTRANEGAYEDESGTADQELAGAEAIDEDTSARYAEEPAKGIGGDDLGGGAGRDVEIVGQDRRDGQEHRPAGARYERAGVEVRQAADGRIP